MNNAQANNNSMTYVYVLLPKHKRPRVEFVAELADQLVERYGCSRDMEIDFRPELDEPTTLAMRLRSNPIKSFVVVCDRGARDYCVIPVKDNLAIVQKLSTTDYSSAWRFMSRLLAKE